jgi:hypothetical protein
MSHDLQNHEHNKQILPLFPEVRCEILRNHVVSNLEVLDVRPAVRQAPASIKPRAQVAQGLNSAERRNLAGSNIAIFRTSLVHCALDSDPFIENTSLVET